MNKTIFRKNIPVAARGRLRFGITTWESSPRACSQHRRAVLTVASNIRLCESPILKTKAKYEAYLRTVEIVCTRKVKDNKELEPPRVRAMRKQSRELESDLKRLSALLLASLFLSYSRRALSKIRRLEKSFNSRFRYLTSLWSARCNVVWITERCYLLFSNIELQFQ